MKILLDMYLNKNFGDDLFLKIISERYPQHIFYVKTYCKYDKNKFSRNVKFKNSIISKISNFITNKFHLYKYNTFNLCKKYADCIVLLGGSMFIEPPKFDSKKVFIKFKDKNKPYFIIGSNFGPYKNKKYLNFYKEIFKDADDICFRDNESFMLFNTFENVRCATDVAFLLNKFNYVQKTEKKVVISVIDLSRRPDLSQYEEQYLSFIINIISYFHDKNYRIVLMSFCKPEGDENAINKIFERIEFKDDIMKYFYNNDLDEAIDCLASSEYIIATRFHAMILGFLFNKKTLPIIYSNKTLNVINDLKFDGYVYNITNTSENVFNKSIISNIKKSDYNYENLRTCSNLMFKELDEFLNKK